MAADWLSKPVVTAVIVNASLRHRPGTDTASALKPISRIPTDRRYPCTLSLHALIANPSESARVASLCLFNMALGGVGGGAG